MRTRQTPWVPASLLDSAAGADPRLLEDYADCDADVHRAAAVAIAGRVDPGYPARVTRHMADISRRAQRVHFRALALQAHAQGPIAMAARTALLDLAERSSDAFIRAEALETLCAAGLLGALAVAQARLDRVDDLRPIDWTLAIAARRGAGSGS